ncbi:hypothetical protein D3C72_581980 [compost metagenome]
MGGDDGLAAAFRCADAQAAFLAVEVSPKDDVDHAADGVGAIEGGGSVEENVHAFDGGGRNGRDVGEITPAARAGHAAAVDQHQGGVRPETAQVHAGRQARIALHRIRSDQGRCRGAAAGIVLGQGGEGFRDGGATGSVEIIPPDHRDRGGGVAWAAQQGAGDDDVVDDHGLREFVPGPALKNPRAAGRLNRHQSGAGQKLVERRVGGHPPAEAWRPTARDLVGGEHELAAGLTGVGVERRRQRTGGDGEVDLGWRRGLGLGGARKGQYGDAHKQAGTVGGHVVFPHDATARRGRDGLGGG